MIRLAARLAVWAGLFVVALSTLGPIELRPETGLPAASERFLAFFAIGLPLAVAYPRHRLLALLVLFGLAGVLEALQTLVPGRHGRLADLDVKAAGALLGASLGTALDIGARLVATRREVLR